tara:strand:- start:13786 stop:15204 length:1419 start_codon:yes stop_codon:yes gene_type:complete
MALRLFDTRSRSKREFETLEEGKVGLYACGITPYSPSHIGHGRQAIAFDIIVRWLRYIGYDVNYVTNFTDVDDKIISVANEEGIDYLEVANRNIADYFEVMDRLNVLRADHYPRVTETIPEIISIISTLIEKEHAYIADDGVYFEIDTSPEKYGQLTGQSLEMVRAGAGGRVADTGSSKRDHRDFALWKFAKPNEPSWQSPWGEGRPGWHIECSAMSLKLLGEKFDIHGGGTDLLFPHHEAEIFQSECCLGHDPVVQYWIHNGMINVDGEKMSKSLGNFWTIKDALEQVDPLILRYTMINAPYRQPIDFNQKMLDESSIHYNRMISVFGEGMKLSSSEKWSDVEVLQSASDLFTNAMNDDFNTRNALAVVQSVVNSIRSDKDLLASGYIWLDEFAGGILGLLPDKESIRKIIDAGESARSDLESIVNPLLKERAEARKSKDWIRADEIRDKLNELGVIVEDSPNGPVWKLSR